MKPLVPGVWSIGGQLATRNAVPGARVYDERLVREGGVEYRIWDPFHSKLAAALAKGLRHFPIDERSSVLYLGSSSGTTVSHLSDITSGLIYAVDISKRMMRELMPLAKQRPNIVPILADAAQPAGYLPLVASPVDVVFQDVAQPDQAEILLRNVEAFRPRWAMLSVKARSIKTAQDPRTVFKSEVDKLRGSVEVVETVKLHPFEKDHVLVVMRTR